VPTTNDTKYEGKKIMIFYFVTEVLDIPSNAVMIGEVEIMWMEAVMAQSGIGTEANYETVW